MAPTPRAEQTRGRSVREPSSAPHHGGDGEGQERRRGDADPHVRQLTRYSMTRSAPPILPFRKDLRLFGARRQKMEGAGSRPDQLAHQPTECRPGGNICLLGMSWVLWEKHIQVPVTHTCHGSITFLPEVSLYHSRSDSDDRFGSGNKKRVPGDINGTSSRSSIS